MYSISSLDFDDIHLLYGKTLTKYQPDAGTPTRACLLTGSLSFLGPKNLKFFYFPIGKFTSHRKLTRESLPSIGIPSIRVLTPAMLW